VLQLERRVNEVVDFYDGKKQGSGGRKGGRHGAYGRGMPDIMRQFGVILREVIFLELICCTFVYLSACWCSSVFLHHEGSSRV